MNKFISVIIPTYRKPERLEMTLEGLSMQDYPRDMYEVIVVNDACDPVTDTVVRRQNHINICCVQGEGRGPACAKNKGIPKAKGDILLFLDDDVLCPAGFLSAHALFYQGASADNTVVTGKRKHLYLELNQHTKQWIKEKLVASFPELMEKSYTDPHCSMLDRVYTDSRPQFSTAWICLNGCNFSAARAVLQRIGYFDDDLTYLEDTEIGLRMWESQADFYYANELTNVHLEHEKEVLGRKMGWTKNYPIFESKHGLTAKLYKLFFNGDIDFDEFDRCYTMQTYPENTGFYGSYWFWEEYALRRWKRREAAIL